MRLLLSAFWCQPGSGGEPHVGWQALLAAAEHYEVWVLTHAANVETLRHELNTACLQGRVHLEGVSLGSQADRLRYADSLRFHWYHDRWQRRAGERARQLDRTLNFDLVHHVTLAAYWTRAGAATLDKPLVWGPVGGGVELPLSLLGELGAAGTAEFLSRRIGRRMLARYPPVAELPRRAAVTLVPNQETAAAIGPARTVRVVPQATCARVVQIRPEPKRSRELAFIGRLVPWKAARLAVRALRHLRHREAVLHIYGDGPDRQRVLVAARRWGLEHRVAFQGRLPHADLHTRLARAAALVHPALHEESGLAVAEALSLGTPVVCLDRGGPRELIRHWPTSPAATVQAGGAQVTARRLAAAVDRFLDDPPPIPPTPLAPTTSFAEALQEAYSKALLMGVPR